MADAGPDGKHFLIYPEKPEKSNPHHKKTAVIPQLFHKKANA